MRISFPSLRDSISSSNQKVEIVEATWKIPNFLKYTSKEERRSVTSSGKVFFVGGRGPPSADGLELCPLPFKLEAFLTRLRKSASTTWHLSFVRVQDGRKRKLPSSWKLLGKLLALRTSCQEDAFQDVNDGLTKVMDFRGTKVHKVKLFEESEAENHVDKEDGALSIYFKWEFTFNIPKDTMAGELSELTDDFESLLKDSANADVEIKVSLGTGQSFQCHKGILAARSPIFRAMFESETEDSPQDVVEVNDILPKAMEHFLSFIYCGRFQDSSWIQSLPQLAYTADKYCVKTLKKICDSCLIRIVTLKNALTLGKLAKRHGLVKAEGEIRKFIAKSAQGLILDTEIDPSLSDKYFEVRYDVPLRLPLEI